MTVTFRHAPPGADTDAPRLQRAFGRARVGFRQSDGQTRLADLWQQGCAKVRLPRVHDGGGPVAVLINTAGGITGGDVIEVEAVFGETTTATLTAQAAERIYRRSAGVGRVSTRLAVEAGATAAWLPQETIVFDGAGLDRSLDVSLASDARFTGCEAIVLGRTAMGETVRRLDLVDRWRVRRGGRLVFADALRLAGDAEAILSGSATGNGAAAFATLLHAGADAEGLVDPAREALDRVRGDDLDGGASAFEGLLVVRLLARDGRALRRGLEPLLACLTGRPLPRVWSL